MNKLLAITCLFVGLFVAELHATANYGSLRNLADGKPATQSSTWKDKYGFATASRALDNNWNSQWYTKDSSCSHTNQDKEPWWEVDLGNTYTIYSVLIKNREDCCSERLAKVKVTIDGKECNYHEDKVGKYATIDCKAPVRGRKVRIQLKQDKIQWLTLCEVNVLGY